MNRFDAAKKASLYGMIGNAFLFVIHSEEAFFTIALREYQIIGSTNVLFYL